MSSIYFTGPSSMYEPISTVGMYSDSTPMVKTPGWSRIVERADTIYVVGGSMANFVTAMFLVDSITQAGGEIKRLVLPYVPGARQDRSNPTGDVLNTLASVGRMIADRWFDEVHILDPHSPASVAAIPNVREYPLPAIAKRIPMRYDGIIAADKGGKDRAEQFADALGLPIYYGGKTRDVSTGKLTGFTLETLPTRPMYTFQHYLVVDDICDGGGTFIGLADKIKEQGASADLFVSHGLFAKGTRDLAKAYSTIYTTDSLGINYTETDVIEIPVVARMTMPR